MSLLLALFGCRSDAPYVVPEEPMPANTVLLSQMMRELSATPGFTDAMLAQLDKGGKKGPALMTPALLKRLRELILGRDWQGLDRFPGWTMQAINPTVRVAGRLVAKDKEAASLSARHPGASGVASITATTNTGVLRSAQDDGIELATTKTTPIATATAPMTATTTATTKTTATTNAGILRFAQDDGGERATATTTPIATAKAKADAGVLRFAQDDDEKHSVVTAFVDLGNYSLEKGEPVSLDAPSTLPGFAVEGLVSELGAGVVRGDGANPALAPMHAESQRLADVLNRLSLNELDGSAPVTVTVAGRSAKTPQELMQALIETGHSVTVVDARYFANFGHFHYKGQEVMMPFWVDSQIRIPGERRSLLVPVSHAEYEWEVRGPKVNATVSWYFGIDGKAEFRTMDTLDQAWVLGRHAHEYRDAEAVEVTRLAGKLTLAYMHQHLARPELPFGGYYPLGVCQDGVAAIERKMTGNDTLFPNTADGELFDDPRDAEINVIIKAIPKDREGGEPEPARIFGSLPTAEFSAITIPGLASDLAVVHAAWLDGSLERTPSWIRKVTLRLVGVAALGMLAAIVVWRRRRNR